MGLSILDLAGRVANLIATGPVALMCCAFLGGIPIQGTVVGGVHPAGV